MTIRGTVSRRGDMRTGTKVCPAASAHGVLHGQSQVIEQLRREELRWLVLCDGEQSSARLLRFLWSSFCWRSAGEVSCDWCQRRLDALRGF